MNKLTPYLITAIAPLCWAGDLVLARSMAGTIPPFTLVFWRWALASLILLPFAWKSMIKDWSRIKHSWGFLSVLSVLGISGFISLLYIGMHTSTPINGAIIQTTTPAIILLLCFFLYDEKITKNQMFGMGLCFFGALYVVFQGDWNIVREMSVVKGDMLILIAAIMYGLYCTLVSKSPKIHPMSFLVSISVLGAIVLLPFYVWEIFNTAPIELNSNILMAILYVAIFPSIVAYMCWNRGILAIGPSKAGILMTLIPLFAALLAKPLLNEPLELYHFIGMLTIFLGMCLFNKKTLQNNSPV